MKNEDLFSGMDESVDVFQREDRCRKTLKTVGKAIFMRLFVVGLLAFVAWKAGGNGYVLLMLALVVFLNAGGIFPLVQEWKKRRAELADILKEMEE